MMKERMAAIFIGGIMLLSVAGFALIGVGRISSNGNKQIEIPTVTNKFLTSEEAVSILRTGRVLIRDVYANNCSACPMKDAALSSFVESFKGFIVLEQASVQPSNTTTVDEYGYVKFEMLSPNGEIRDLQGVEMSQEKLTDLFCSITAVQPKECLLRQVTAKPTPVMGGNETINQTGGQGVNATNSANATNGTVANGTV